MKSLLDVVVEHTNKNRNQTFLDYINGRGWTEATINKWGLGFFPKDSVLSLIATINNNKFDAKDLESKFICKKIEYSYRSLFFNRIIFPILDPHGRIVAIAGRVLDNSKPKYFNSVFPKATMLFGLNHTKEAMRRLDRALVFEGYADVITCDQNGVSNVTCCMGTAFTEEHFVLLSRYASEIVVFFDNDAAGRLALKRFNEKKLDEKKRNTKIYRCFLTVAKDADEYFKTHTADDFNKFVEESISNIELQNSLKAM